MILDKEKLLIACGNKGFSFKELREKAGISIGIFKTLKQEKNIQPKTVGKLAKTLGVSVEEIVKESR